MTGEVTAIIGLGSNLGHGKAILREAWNTLGRVPGIRLNGLSRPYITAPVGMTSRHWFTNAVGRLHVVLTPLELLRELLTVEGLFGRTREISGFGYQDRSLDLDLLTYGTRVIDTPELTLPHPRMSERFFVLAPLVEIEPDYTDGRSGLTVAHMLTNLEQRIISGEVKNQEIIASQWDV